MMHHFQTTESRVVKNTDVRDRHLRLCLRSSRQWHILFVLLVATLSFSPLISTCFGFHVRSFIPRLRSVDIIPTMEPVVVTSKQQHDAVSTLSRERASKTLFWSGSDPITKDNQWYSGVRILWPVLCISFFVLWSAWVNSALAVTTPLTSLSTSTSYVFDYLPIVTASISLWNILQGIALAMLVPIGMALYQGATAIINYQTNFGDAPPPKVPAHGVVIATTLTITATNDKVIQRTNPNMKFISKIFSFDSISNNNNNNPNDVKERDFLRLLLIGDSLAVGIGQKQSCTPVMPEAIAKEISKATGKAVFWTCHGESGASTSWIIKMLQNSTELSTETIQPEYQPPDFINWVGKNYKFHGNYFTNGTYATEGMWMNDNRNMDSIEFWRNLLESFRNNFDPAAMGPYDIVVLLTGPNDLKTLLLPFMFQDDSTNIRSTDSKTKKGNRVTDDLMALMQTINNKIAYRYNKTLELCSSKAEMMLDAIYDESNVFSEVVKIFRSNQTMNEKFDSSVLISLEVIRARADAISNDLQSKAATLSDAYMLLTSSNGSISEKLQNDNLMKLLLGNTTRTKANAIRDELYQVASDAFKTLRSNYEELERLFSIASDFSQILVHDDFKLVNSALPVINEGNKQTISQIEYDDTWGISKEDETDEIATIRLNEVVRPGRPLFILPGMPARALPIFRSAPLKWFTIPVFDLMDRKKIQLAQSNPDIVFVRDPSLRDISDYETKRGRIWNRIANEQILLSLKDIREEDCVSIEDSMHEYFLKKMESPQIGQKYASKVFSPDGIHPNDFGYDLWGRHIGLGISQHLPKMATGESQEKQEKRNVSKTSENVSLNGQTLVFDSLTT